VQFNSALFFLLVYSNFNLIFLYEIFKQTANKDDDDDKETDS